MFPRRAQAKIEEEISQTSGKVRDFYFGSRDTQNARFHFDTHQAGYFQFRDHIASAISLRRQHVASEIWIP